MKNCRHPGVQGDACRGVEYCTLRQQRIDEGDLSVTSARMKECGCPTADIVVVQLDEESIAKRNAILLEKVKGIERRERGN